MTRPRGFTDWRPQAKTRRVLDQVATVLEEYREYLPLTVRQVFYRLVGNHGYEKSENAYERLSEHLVLARRSGRVPFSSIRDDGTSASTPFGFDGMDDFWSSVAEDARDFRFHRQAGQRQWIELWVEAAGMVPLVFGAVGDLGVTAYSSGGFDSVTAKHDAAQRIVSREVPTLVLHVGDHDPSGVALYAAAREDVTAFVERLQNPDQHGPWVSFERLAVTPDQVDVYGLLTGYAKAHDKRDAWPGGETVQVEAFPPDVLRTVVREAVESRLDATVRAALIEQEEQDRARIVRTVQGIVRGAS